MAEALAISDGRILAVGSVKEIEALRGPSTRYVDLAGRLATPGLNEAHMHVPHVGIGMVEMNLRPERGFRTIEALLSEVEKQAAQTPEGQWVAGRGYDHSELAEGRHPTIEELDRVAPSHPVYIERTCGHMAIANSRAMAAAGIDDATGDPDGGVIEKKNGRLTGLLAERAMRLIVDAKPKPDAAFLADALERAHSHLVTEGFTSVMDAAVGFLAGMEELAAYEIAEREDRLKLRSWLCIFGNPVEGIGPQAFEAGYRSGRRIGRSEVGAMKIFCDGSAGALTAAMSEAYLAGEPENFGVLTFSDDVVHDWLKRYHEQGYQLAIHAIGDRAIEQVLTGMERADTPVAPIQGRRHRIEHCGYVTSDQIQRMCTHGIDPVPQPAFLYEFGDLYVRNVGMERSVRSYPMKSWMVAGLHPAASSDAPVCNTDPFANLYTMITRKSRNGTELGPDETLTMAEALHAYTALGAYTQFAEAEKGTLSPGKLADVAVFSRNLFTATPEQVRDETRCDMTIIGGEIVHEV
ncbi:MAG: amidohydrolase [Pseudooceanicola nanhaiensis]|uniref:amidohydrolase n=1 Tax=Rhodobacterales TaxID=204455 RepID=UPI00405962A4